MRAYIVGSLAVVFAVGCGPSSDGTTGGTGGTGGSGGSQFSLKIATTGNGLVRGAGSDCRGSCSVPYSAGSQVHLVAIADSGSSFVGWAGACNGTSGCDLTLDADKDVSATFAVAPPPPPSQRRLTVVVQGKGRVTSAPAGVDCDSAQCSADFTAGTSVALTATAASGYGFAGWGTDCSGGGGCAVLLSKDATVYANFVALPPPPPAEVHLSAGTTGPGTVTGAGLNCGESSATCDVKLTGGTSVTLTATPAGGSRFGGWGGACSGKSTTCQLTVTADTKVTAEFLSEVLVLAANDGTNLGGGGMALNSTHVFWSRYVSGSYGIWAVGKNGGEAVRVALGFASALVADDGYLYWTDQSNLYSTPVGGGQVALLFSGYAIGKLALDETGALYWTVGPSSGANSGSVHRMQDRADTSLAKGQSPSGAVAVDGTHVYFADYGTQGSIRRVPRNGGTVETVMACGSTCFPQAVRTDSQNVYFRVMWSGYPAQNGQVQVMSKSDFKPRALSGGNGSGGYMYGMDVDVNAGVAFWNWAGGQGPYGIFSANADGSGFRAVDSSNDTSFIGLRVDDGAVYYWHGGALIRRLK